MKRMWMVGVLALLTAATVAAHASAAAGGNSVNAKLCQKDGWKSLFRSDSSTFANRGECVSYGARGNTILTAPPNLWQVACEQNGGTFSVSDQSGGHHLSPPAFAYLCTPVSFEIWDTVLNPICFAFPDHGTASWIHATGEGSCVRNGTT